MPDAPTPYQFAGFSSPNTTPVPDVLFDELLHQLDNAELRVLLYIIRRTYGFKKSSDDISISQMIDGITRKDGTVLDRGTGLARSSIKRAIAGLLEKRIIIRRHNKASDGSNEPNTYALHYQNETTTPRSGDGPTPLVPPADPPLVQQRTPQETGSQQTDLSSSNIRKATQTGTKAAPLPRDGRVGRQTQPAARGGEPEALASVVRRLPVQAPVVKELTKDDEAAISAYLADFAAELGDKAPLKSTVTRACNLYQQSRLGLDAFIGELYTARGSVKEIASLRGASTGSPTDKSIKNRMSYFFSILEDKLGVRQPAQVST